MANITLTDPIYYNGTNILSAIPGWLTTSTDTYRYAPKVLNRYDLPNSDFAATTSGQFNGRKFGFSGVIRTVGREDLDSQISTLKKVLRPNNVTVQMPVSGEQRYFYSVSVENIIISDVQGGFCAIDVELVSDDPCNYKTITTEALNVVNLTSGIKSYPVTLEGTAKQLPVITYVIDSLTASSNDTVRFTNPSTGTYIEVSRDWEALDTLVIDCLNRTVEVNDIATDYSGSFPYWESGAQYFNYTDEFVARQVDINVTYRKRYE